MSDLGEDGAPIDRSLLDAARPALEPTDLQRSRLRRAVLGAIATSAVTTGTAAGAQAAASATGTATAAGAAGGGATAAGLGLGLGAKLAIGAIAIASVVAAVVASQPVGRGAAVQSGEARARPEGSSEASARIERARVAERTREPVVAETPEAPRAPASPLHVPAPAPARVASERVVPRAPLPTRASEPSSTASALGPRAPAEDPVLAEMRLLAQARAAIARHDGTAAMALLDEHARRFPTGELREERLANRVAALCALGEPERAHTEATAFFTSYPGSVHSSGVRAADCWSDASGATP